MSAGMEANWFVCLFFILSLFFISKFNDLVDVLFFIPGCQMGSGSAEFGMKSGAPTQKDPNRVILFHRLARLVCQIIRLLRNETKRIKSSGRRSFKWLASARLRTFSRLLAIDRCSTAGRVLFCLVENGRAVYKDANAPLLRRAKVY